MLIGFHLHNRLVELRIKRLTFRFHRRQPFCLKHAFQLAENHFYALRVGRSVRALPGRAESPFKVIDDRQQLGNQLGGSVFSQFFLLFDRTAPEIIEIGLRS
ncbi:hypothetical protein D3C76_1454480 [compost metagenome]